MNNTKDISVPTSFLDYMTTIKRSSQVAYNALLEEVLKGKKKNVKNINVI